MGTTYYVTHDGPNGNGSGDSVGNSMAWQAAADAATAGDIVWPCNTGTYAFGGTALDYDTAHGSVAELICTEGRSADGTAAAQVTMTVTGTYGLRINAKNSLLFRDIYISASGAGAWWPLYHSSGSGCIFDNIKVSGAARDGINLVTGGHNKLVGCEVYGCTWSGIVDTGTGNEIVRCSSHDNTLYGLHMDENQTVVRYCEFYDNDEHGVYWESGVGAVGAMSNCTIALNGGSGILFEGAAAAYAPAVENCAIARNAAYAMNGTAATAVLAFGNFIPSSGDDANTSGSTNNVNIYGDNIKANLTSGSALFTSVADGSEDFSTGSGSVLRAAGYPSYLDIGSEQHVDPAAGGDTLGAFEPGAWR
jgi:parallel beta helix pectate lyase-like protein